MRMKKTLSAICLFALLFFSSCANDLNNSITIKSIAAETIYVNILGRVLTVAPNTTQVIKDIAKGTYAYTTSFSIPAGVQSSTTEGAVAGNLALNPGTKITILYSSRIQVSQGGGGTGSQSSYVLSATVSSNDKNSTITGSN